MTFGSVRPVAVLALVLLCLTPASVFAYVGPGSGVTVIGAAIALVGGAFLAIVGFVWYPVKRLLRSRRRAEQPTGRAAADSAAR